MQQINGNDSEEETANAKAKILSRISKFSKHLKKDATDDDDDDDDTTLYKTHLLGTPLEISVESGFFQAAKLLIENGATIQDLKLAQILNGKEGQKQFAEYALKKNTALVNELTENNQKHHTTHSTN